MPYMTVTDLTGHHIGKWMIVRDSERPLSGRLVSVEHENRFGDALTTVHFPEQYQQYDGDTPVYLIEKEDVQ